MAEDYAKIVVELREKGWTKAANAIESLIAERDELIARHAYVYGGLQKAWADLDAAESPSPRSGEEERLRWRPIESAPKDGKDILVAKEGTDWVNRAWWPTEHEGTEPTGTDGWLMVGGGWRPTHWMPLPTLAALRPATQDEGAAQPRPEDQAP